MLFRVLVLAALAWLSGAGAVGAAELNVGDRAPELKPVGWFNSQPMTLAGLKNKVVVVEFWATWCGPCLKSVPHLNQIHADFRDRGVVVIGCTDEGPETCRPTIRNHGMRYPVAVGSNAVNLYGVDAIPAAFIIHQGKIAWKGHPSGLDDALKTVLDAATPAVVVGK